MKNKTIRSVICICLVALLLCGGIAYGTVRYVNSRIRSIGEASMAASDTLALSRQAALPENMANLQLNPRGGALLDPTEIYELACKQVVGISTEITSTNVFGQVVTGSVTGTGFIISSDGYILTNNHVVEDAYKGDLDVTVILHDGSKYDARIVGVEGDNNDIAVLKIDATGLSAVTLGDSDAMKVGESVYLVGNPLGELTYTMTSGIVSALDREIAADQNSSVNMFQLDAAVNSGNSGGPVYNGLGQVVGVVTAKYKSTGVEGLGFAIPINDAAGIADELIEHGYVTGKPSFGIMGRTMTDREAAYFNSVAGVYVYSVDPGSCAAAAGIRQGDVITKLGDVEILTMADLSTAKKAYRAGDSAQVTVFRSGDYKTFTVVFDEILPDKLPGTGTGSGETAPSPETPEPTAPAETPEEGDNGGAQSLWDFFFGRFFNWGQQESEPEATPEPTRTPDGQPGHFGQ